MALLSSCAGISVPVDIEDANLWYLKGASGAVEMQFLTEGQVDITQSQWNAISEGMVCMELTSFSAFNTEIAKLCSQINCDYETMQKLQNLANRLNTANQNFHP